MTGDADAIGACVEALHRYFGPTGICTCGFEEACPHGPKGREGFTFGIVLIIVGLAAAGANHSVEVSFELLNSGLYALQVIGQECSLPLVLGHGFIPAMISRILSRGSRAACSCPWPGGWQ